MNFKKLFPSKYLKSSDIDGDTLLTIDRLVVEWVGQGADAEEKPILYFRDRQQGLCLNQTNATAIAEIYGEDTDGWPGNQIVLYPTRTPFGGKLVDCLRVKAPAAATVGADEFDRF